MKNLSKRSSIIFKFSECYKDNPKLLEQRTRAEDKKKTEQDKKFLYWYKQEMKRKGYKVSKDIGKQPMIKKEPYKKYVLDENNLPVNGLCVSFPTRRNIRKIREEGSKRGIRNIKSTYYGHYISVLPPELVNKENVDWLNLHEAVREPLPLPIDQLYERPEEPKQELLKVDNKKWAAWAKKL